jgi:hypothetical protein
MTIYARGSASTCAVPSMTAGTIPAANGSVPPDACFSHRRVGQELDIPHALSQFIEDHDASFDKRAAIECRLNAVWKTVEERNTEGVFGSRRRQRAIRSSIRQAIASTSVGCSSATTAIPPTGWARGLVRSCGNRTDTLALLADLNAGVKSSISYQSRETEGTQTPVETLDRGWGSCRDLAVLLIEAARYWHERAEDARRVAREILDPISRRAMLDIAESYERLARRAIERAQSSPQLRPGVSSPEGRPSASADDS